MRNLMVLMLTVVAAVVFSLNIAAEGKGKMKHGKAGTKKEAPAVVKPGPQATCPIEKMKINKEIYSDYKGKRVYFCCKHCIQEFNADPEKYMKEFETNKVTLEDAPKK